MLKTLCITIFQLAAVLQIGLFFVAYWAHKGWYLLGLCLVELLLASYLALNSANLLADYRGGFEALWLNAPGWLFYGLFWAAWSGKLGLWAQRPLVLGLVVILSLLSFGFSFWAQALGSA
ncbi:hypothetical protein COW36_08290 [bacterium (Candidatus Blackallbacteria) CG17_big_fil_post_rev_8_21_14_2_50_48_46]|uniref:Uncharacterized protein n=1 Tax=bacterium (Candidatus Blackallbacteria) CG17_big_fil_post_rev_8_21_14_2_50_48_46 TaxID=2014261 RepID=A0A2M7G6B9_9BACT|nr:MAG: hypothetical protein COW64_24830 [bacterium (Candidatus Blackallbacteria) CG18_big_fil_WC_8_21_14_2_50_49_26]PIW17489.1 MAG: hypothetical protein COW36_08290 [bacterium (Candidatus Blackallbacteria) CG17_big_fil_post_rev_8_21_14_2_50_48_46]PIW48343.1 MAG: hypothetical protein COW20_09645 [bacterium (Candidatus Blackallbacteria) CG13_big_fil_rev_8_21_14_2_50_49_14]